MVNDETIRTMVEEEYIKNIMGISKIEVYRMTSSIPKEGLKLLAAHYSGILVWISQVLKGDSNKVTDEDKVRIIKAILEIDKIYTDDAAEEE